MVSTVKRHRGREREIMVCAVVFVTINCQLVDSGDVFIWITSGRRELSLNRVPLDMFDIMCTSYLICGHPNWDAGAQTTVSNNSNDFPFKETLLYISDLPAFKKANPTFKMCKISSKQ